MKINVEVDCTPTEARAFMGLPDLSPVHDVYVNLMLEAVDKQTNPEAFQAMLQSWAPMGEAGMSMWRNMFEAGAKSAK
jgi:oligoendopeptidase F